MIDVLFTPADHLAAVEILPQSQVVVLDVIRATSTITTALHHGARAVELFPSLDAARRAKAEGGANAVLAGETNCLKPEDFDLGNSPREFVAEKIGGTTVLLATTNGTLAASRATAGRKIFIASLLNASATAEALLPEIDSLNTLFFCAGTHGKSSIEDVIGAGSILFHLLQATYRTNLPFTDNAWLAYHAFAAVRGPLAAALRLGAGGYNVIRAGLEEDIDHCARLDAMPMVITLEPRTMSCTKSRITLRGNARLRTPESPS